MQLKMRDSAIGGRSVSAENEQLLLRPDTTVTCPKCADEFSLDQGFAKKALEQLAETSAQAIAAVRDSERAQVEKRAQQVASERARAAQDEVESLKRLLKEQAEAHTKALAEVRSLAERSVAGREDALAAREKDLEVRASEAARARDGAAKGLDPVKRACCAVARNRWRDPRVATARDGIG